MAVYQDDIIQLTALRDLLVSGEIESDAGFLVKAMTRLIDTKANALRARHAIEMKTAVPVGVVHSYVKQFVGLMTKYCPADRQAAMVAEMRIMAGQPSR